MNSDGSWEMVDKYYLSKYICEIKTEDHDPTKCSANIGLTEWVF